MYGYPLTIYLAGSVFGEEFGLSHNDGHLRADLIGCRGDPHFSPFHVASWLFIGSGFWLISAAWGRLHAAARVDELATDGAYQRIRHPQHLGFVAREAAGRFGGVWDSYAARTPRFISARRTSHLPPLSLPQ